MEKYTFATMIRRYLRDRTEAFKCMPDDELIKGNLQAVEYLFAQWELEEARFQPPKEEVDEFWKEVEEWKGDRGDICK